MQSHDNREPNERFTLIWNLAEKIKTAEDPQKVLSRWVGRVMDEVRESALYRWLVQVGYRARRHVGLITLVLALTAVVIFWSLPKKGLVDELRGEITGIAITLILVDRLLSIRTRVEHENELLEQVHSPVRDIAVEALRLIRKDEQLFSMLNMKRSGGVRWSGADLSRVDLSGANLSEADLIGARLYGADMRGANLIGADMRGAHLLGADLSGANLLNADLSGANLHLADLSGADLSGANISEAKLSVAKYTDSTKWPKGFDYRAAGAELVEEGVPMRIIRKYTVNFLPERNR